MSTVISLMITFVILSCEDENENATKISTYNDDESHKAGHNCMSCHTPGGEGEGWFEVAGTVYDSTLIDTYPNATVKFYSGPNGTSSRNCNSCHGVGTERIWTK